MREDTEGLSATRGVGASNRAARGASWFSRLFARAIAIFFTGDTSPDNRRVVELQRRACWLGLAIIAQALNEIDHGVYMPYVPFLRPWQGLIPFLLILASFAAMVMAFRPVPRKKRGEGAISRRPHLWQKVVLVMVLLTSIGGGIEAGRAVAMSFFLPPQYTNDGTSLDTNAAWLLLQGHNPYTDSNILQLVRRFPIQPNWTTPLRQGQLADRLNYPTASELRSVLDTDLKTGIAPEFESKVSYPSLSFLSLVPYVWLNIYNVMSLYLFSYLALVAIGWKLARPEMRPWVLLLALANVSMWTSVVGGNLDIFYILLIVLAWLVRDSRWWSAIFLGLALATKQIAWFFVPFYIIMVIREHGIKDIVSRLSIAGVIALAFNLPFILWSPQAWLAGVLAPVSDPMFPMGVGLISLSSTPLMPFLPSSVYTILEGIAMLGCLVWYWHICKRHPEAAMLLAVLPLFLAWRSLPSYFYSAALPLFLLQVARIQPWRGDGARKKPRPLARPRFANEGMDAREISTGLGTRAALHRFALVLQQVFRRGTPAWSPAARPSP